MLPLACYNDKQFYQETLPEAICCCLQTCLLLILILLIEYFMYTKSCSHSSYIPLMSYTASCVPIIMYSLGLFVVVYLLIKLVTQI